jgi:excisionase family DNA binding protein
VSLLADVYGTVVCMSTAVPSRPLLSVRETAALLGVSTKQVRRLIAAGEIPAIRLGSSKGSAIRIDRDELEAWLYSAPGEVA